MQDPIARFQELFARAQKEESHDATAVALATATSDGRPAARMVLLKGVDADGFVFFTNYESRKGEEIARNPHAALCFFWPGMYVQVRVEGPLSRVSEAESDAYFESRPRGHRLGAWSSNQSRKVASKEALEKQFAAVEARYGAEGHVPRPPHWGGYRIAPLRIEFWFGRENRMHERELFERASPSSAWSASRLQP